MDPSTPAPAATAPPIPVAVFGRDAGGRAHASYFAGGEAEGATRAAAAMGLHVLPLAGPACDGLADQMPAGRLFPSGKALIPLCRDEVYERLAALAGVPVAPAAPKVEAAPKPPRVAKATKAAAEPQAMPKPAKAAAAKAAVEATSVATSWQTVAAGSLVLATTGETASGWFETVVVEGKPDQLFVLRWRDWPDEPLFLRRVDQLALLPVGTALVADE